MKKLIAVLLGVLLLVNIVACAAPVEDTDSTTTTNTTTTTVHSKATESTQPTSTTVSPSSGGDVEGQGGGYGESYVYINGEKHLGENLFSYYLSQEFTEDDTKELYAEIAAEKNGTHYAYTGASLQRRILALNIPREKIEEINEASKEMYAGHKQYDRLVFTDEEINDMYTLTREEYNKKYIFHTSLQCFMDIGRNEKNNTD